jgi:transcriptional regulator GlxA family with amidase domain
MSAVGAFETLPPPGENACSAPIPAIRAATIGGAVSLAELARACDLSPGHFARAFKQTTGQSPHRWLIAQRIEKAKQLMDRRS